MKAWLSFQQKLPVCLGQLTKPFAWLTSTLQTQQREGCYILWTWPSVKHRTCSSLDGRGISEERKRSWRCVWQNVPCLDHGVCVRAGTCAYEHIKFCVGMRGKQYSQFISLVSSGGCRMFIAGDRMVISCGKRLLTELIPESLKNYCMCFWNILETFVTSSRSSINNMYGPVYILFSQTGVFVEQGQLFK